VRVLLDYRPALRQRTGVGEYTHQLVRALLAERDLGRSPELRLTLFSSSARDRFAADPELAGAAQVDRRIPVSLLNLAWHRLEWPPVEALAPGTFDIAHSMHPLLMPARDAAQVITIYDLNFLRHPERTRAEIRRDYPALVQSHAHRADAIIVISQFTAREVQQQLGVAADRITICYPGRPDWQPRADRPDRHGRGSSGPERGYVLFLGTLEPRKNIGTLLDAYELLAGRRPDLPELLLAGRTTEQSAPWLDRLTRAPLKQFARYVGYVAPSQRERIYAGARLLVQPSFEEGFGMPVLEAMTVGVPVVAANAGALPEVGGNAVVLVSHDDPSAMATAIERLLDDQELAARCVAQGLARSREYSWAEAARGALQAYERAAARHAPRQGAA
jgi:glycosyltransferase involved in cell wall biosynthesis